MGMLMHLPDLGDYFISRGLMKDRADAQKTQKEVEPDAQGQEGKKEAL